MSITQPYRILIHWQNFPPYAAACVAKLRQEYPVETLVLFNRLNVNAPFNRKAYGDVGETCDITDLGKTDLYNIVQKFCPSAALVGGWIRYARILAGAVKKQGAPVIAASDIINRGTFRQRMFPLYHRLVLRRLHDYYWVPGGKGQEYLIQNGISPKTIWKGLYSPNVTAFGRASLLRREKYTAWPRTFLFVGQYIDRKGVPELLDAFERADTGCNLLMCGQGQLKETIDEYAHRLGNISDVGFVQPEQLPDVMAQACALVLPSHEDNWGLVILEAAASGLPLICSDACGAAYDLLAEGKNGITIPARNTEALVEALQKVASLTDETLEKMSQESLKLASQYGPARWASYLYQKLTEVVPHDR